MQASLVNIQPAAGHATLGYQLKESGSCMTAKPYGSSSSSMIHEVHTKTSTTVTVYGYLISISIKVYKSWMRSRYIKIQSFTIHPNTWKFVKNTPLRVVLLTLFSMFVNVVRSSLSCFIYYMKRTVDC